MTQAEARRLRDENARLRKVLRDVRDEIEVCDWRCSVCGTDPEMKETDLADLVRGALSTKGGRG